MSGEYPYASPPEAKAWQAQWPPECEGSSPPLPVPPLALIVAGIMLILSAGNLLMVPLAQSASPSKAGWLVVVTLLLAIVGSIGAQGALLTILVVFGSGPLWRRLVWQLALAAMAVLAWCMGLAMVAWDWVAANSWEDFVTVVLALPLVALACQAAPWLVRIYGRWRVERLLGSAESTNGSPFVNSQESRVTIRELLAGTVLVGLTLAAARLGKPDNVGDGEYWVALLISSGSAGLVFLIGGLPTLYLLLGLRNVRWGIVGVLAMVAIAMTTLVVFTLLLPGGPNGAYRMLFALAPVAGFIVPLAATLLLARRYGYRLIRS